MVVWVGRFVLSGECVLPRGVSVRVVLRCIGRGPHRLPGRYTVVEPGIRRYYCVFSLWYANRPGSACDGVVKKDFTEIAYQIIGGWYLCSRVHCKKRRSFHLEGLMMRIWRG